MYWRKTKQNFCLCVLRVLVLLDTCHRCTVAVSAVGGKGFCFFYKFLKVGVHCFVSTLLIEQSRDVYVDSFQSIKDVWRGVSRQLQRGTFQKYSLM